MAQRLPFPATLFEFQRQFGTEQACFDYLVASRWPDGFDCPRCGWREAYELPKRKLLQCKGCGYQASATAGTVMHRSRMPIQMWFYAAWLMSTHTPGMSAVQFQRQMGIANYETAFQMLHKLRAAMVKPGRDRLHGAVEIDESYVGGSKKGLRGRGAEGKAIVVGAVEVSKGKAVRVRLGVLPNVKQATLVLWVEQNVEPGTVVKTDGWTGYDPLTDAGYRHRPEVEGSPERASKILPHIHRVFSNLKRWVLGTHHGVSPQHLQAYLNEYTFRFNRRQTPMAAFQTLLGLSDERQGPTYESLYAVAKGSPEAWKHPNPKRRKRRKR